MSEVSFIKEGDAVRFAVLPIAEYERLLAAAEDLADIAAYDAAKAAGGEYVPDAVVKRIVAGENPIRVWREHRGLTLQDLASTADISKPYLSEIETGKKEPSLDVLRKLADALGLMLDDLA